MAVASIARPALSASGLDYKWKVMICTIFGTFMTMLDSTIVNIALPKITNVFGVTVNEGQLVITSYMLALAVIMPATGYLSDTFGTKRLFLITMALFTGGSLLCGLAWNNTSLVVFRIIQGLGGGMMSPLGMTMLFKAVPVRERNTIMGIYGLPLILAPVLGPTVGGYLVEYVDWRVIFTLNVPIGIVGMFLASAWLRETELIKGLKFDLRGFLLSAVGFSGLLLGLTDAGTDGWTSPSILVRFAVGIVCLSAWVWVELTDEQPLLELRLFKNPTFALATLVNFVLTVGMFGGQLLLPVFLQNFRGLGAAETGMITMTQALAMLPLMPLVGRLADKFGTRTLLLVGLPLVAISMWQFSALSMDTSDTQIRLWLAARGITMGLVMMPAMTAALNTVPHELTSRGSALTNVMRQVFGSFGTAIFVTLLQSRTTFHANVLEQTATGSNFALQQAIGQAQQWVLLHGGNAVQAQADALLMVFKQLQMAAAVQAFDDVFMVAAVITLLAIVPALFIGGGKSAESGHSEMAVMME
jgi:EmrB/QacA subfamily drug resistance transporter